MGKATHRLLKNLELLSELGRQRCFELDNPFYYRDAHDANEPGNEKDIYWRKERPNGEIYLVTLQVEEIKDETYSIKDTIIRRIK